MRNPLYKIYQLTSRYPWLSVGVLLVVIGAMLWPLRTIQLSENILTLLPQNSELEHIEEVMQQVGLDGQLVIHVSTEKKNNIDQLIKTADEVHDQIVRAHPKIIESSLIRFEGQQMGDLYNDFLNHLPFFLDASELESLSQRITADKVKSLLENYQKGINSPIGILAAEQFKRDPFALVTGPLSRLREWQIDDNFHLVKQHLITRDSQHLVFFIHLKASANETAANLPLISHLDEISTKFHEAEFVKVEYYGAPAVALANAQRIRSDVQMTVSVAMVALFLLIAFFYRSIWSFLLILTPAIFGGLCGLGVLTMIKDEISTIALAVGSVLLGITIDYALHVFTHAKKAKNKERLLSEVGGSTLLSGITTSTAFFALTLLSSPALNDLGIFASISVLSAALFTVIVLPHLVRLKDDQGVNENLVERCIVKLSQIKFHKHQWLWIAMVLISLVSLWTWKNVQFEEDMMTLNYQTPELIMSEKNLNAISSYSEATMMVAVQGMTFAEALDKNAMVLERLETLKTQNIVEAFSNPSQIIPSPEQAQNRLQRWDAFWTDEKAQLLSQLGPTEFVENSLTKNRIEWTDSLMQNILSKVQKHMVFEGEDGSVSVVSTIKSSRQNKDQIISQLKDSPGVVILDKSYLTGQMVDLLKDDFKKLVNLSMIAIFIILLVWYGRIELALMAYLPILCSWFWVLGLMGLFGLKFNIVNIIICTFIFGLGVDYSIFTLRGLLQDFKYGRQELHIFKQSILISLFTTLLGIGVLGFGQHPALQSIALMAIIGITSSIVLAFTLEIGVFNFFIGHRKKRDVIPFTLASFLITIFAFSYFLFGCLVLLFTRAILLLPLGSVKKKKMFFHWLMMKFTGSLISVMANFKKDIIGRGNAQFDQPAVIIANHHSFIDILILLMFDPRVLLMVKDWVYYSPFFGKSVQYADFIHTSKGVEAQLEVIEKRVKEGFSVAVFPEGTRSGKFELSRFHKGAFYLADKLKLDIQPVILHGSNLVMPKGDDFYLKNNKTTIKFLPRIHHDDSSFGEGYRERTKLISQHFKDEYGKVRREIETPSFFKEILLKNFLYKGPILEWYMKVKMKMESNYELLHQLIPMEGKIYDLGCGYGMLSLALGMSSAQRQILACDYDLEKINVASACAVVPSNVKFFHSDVLDVIFDRPDVVLLSDVLHYLQKKEQINLLDKIAMNLPSGGQLLIRDGDKANAKGQRWTKLSEFWSTNLGFNKTRNELHFIDKEYIRNFAERQHFKLSIFEQSKTTSNIMFVLTKQ